MYLFCCIYLLLFVFCSKFEINIEQQRMEIMLLMYEDATSISQGLDRNFRKKNQARTQEHKNLAWRDNSCLATQDAVYMVLVRRSWSYFSDKNLSCNVCKNNLDWSSKKNKNLERTMTRTSTSDFIHSLFWPVSQNSFSFRIICFSD
jgi:hypothetical protein